MINSQILENTRTYEIEHFTPRTLRLESEVLKDNPLKDPSVRFIPVLEPKNPHGPLPVVFLLGGFTGNAPYYFNPKFNQLNTVQELDLAYGRGEAPTALYVFVDAMTTWGGSQFLNSAATGRYEDYIVQEVVPLIQSLFPVSKDPSSWCVMGGSSGGYGALHLGSKYPEIFGLIGAIAPDSFFQASLLPEIYPVLPLWEKFNRSGFRALEDLRAGKLTKLRNWHAVLNVFGMASCYSAKGEHGDFNLPVDPYTGIVIESEWKKWLSFDPIYFLAERLSQLKRIDGIYLDVGNKDNFHLQFGARQISELLKQNHIPLEYVEFDGTHFDIGERRTEVFRWLSGLWRG